jgi:O-Antigen ligase
MLVISPLLLGSNRAVFWALNGLIASIALISLIFGRSRFAISWSMKKPDGIAFWLFLGSLLWMLVQWWPGVPSFLAHPAWAFVPWASGRITIDSGATLQTIVWWLSMLTVFVATALANRSSRITNYLLLISIMGIAVALFGLANAYYNWRSVGLLEKTAYEGWLTSTFVNRNSAASFFAIGLSALTALTIQKYRIIDKEFARKGRVSSTFLAATSGLFYYLAGLALLYIAVLLTGSRAGILSAILAPFIVFALSLEKSLKQRWILPTISFLILGAIALGASALMERANSASSSAQSRINLNADSLSAIAARPLLGHGAGAFQFTEPLFHSDAVDVNLIWNRAHNSFLEAAVDLGVPFTLLWIAGFGTLCIMLWRMMRASNEFKPATAVFFALVFTEGLHAWVDFSLQIQAIAIYAACITGLAVGENLKSSKGES